MVGHDVHVDEMDDLTPEELEYLLEYPDELDTHPVAVVFADLRSALQSVEAPAPGPELAAFLGTSASSLASVTNQDYGVSRAAEEGPFRRRSTNARRKRKVGRSVAAIAATTTGKILLGTTAAAAAFGTAQATGVVDFTSNEPSADIAIASDVSASTATRANEFRVDAEAAGTLGVFVEDGQVRLADISSASGWNGFLKADTDTAVLVVFQNDSDGDRQVSVLLTLNALDPERTESTNLSSFVTVEVVNEDGATRTLWFGNDGAPLSDISTLAELVIVVDTLDTDLGLDTDLELDLGLGDTELDLDAGVRIGADDGLGAQAGASLELGTTDLQLDTDLELELGTHTGTNPDLGIGLGTDVGAQLGTDGVHVGTDIQSNLGSGSGTDLGVNLDTDIDLGLDTGVDLNADVNLDTDIGVDADIELDVDLSDDLDIDLGLDTGLDLTGDDDVDIDADLDLGLNTNGDLGADVDLDLELDVLDLDADIDLGLDLDLGLGSLFGN